MSEVLAWRGAIEILSEIRAGTVMYNYVMTFTPLGYLEIARSSSKPTRRATVKVCTRVPSTCRALIACNPGIKDAQCLTIILQV